MPAGLVARAARADVLAGLELREEASREATALLGDLKRGRWPLTRGQFEHLIDEAVRLGATGGPSPLDVAVASAVSDLWTTWRTQPTPRGSKLVREGDVPLLVMWRTSADRLAAWVVEPRALLKRVADPGPDISLTDAEGFAVAGSADDPDGRVTRAIAETRLPWSVHVGRDGSPAAAPGLTRGRLVLAGLVVMLGFLAAGSYFIGRAVKQEMDLARLQSDFVSAVSHEFRTPLAAMRQLSELLAAGRVPLAERRQQYYDSLAGESRRLQRLVENLLNFGRFEAGARPYQLEPLDARALVEQVVAEFQSSLPHPACPIEVHGSGDPVALLADREAMALALHNLIDNAVKYSGAGRTVRVEWARRDDRVALSVRDEGPGVAADERARIFQKFVRGAAAAAANVRGTGVGLAMVRRIALAHGGTVGVSSEPGAGSCFTITLPVSVPREKHLLSG
jgi:signal transduction histidine kinase